MKMRNQISKRQLSQGTSHMGMKEIKKVPKQECEIIQLLNRAHKPRTKKKKNVPYSKHVHDQKSGAYSSSGFAWL